MTQHSYKSRLAAFARAEWVELSRVNLSRRPWQMPCVAGLTAALPVALGAWLGGFSQGLLAALGTMVFVYITDTTMERRLLTLMGMSFAITACFALGLVAAQIYLAAVPVIVAVTMLVSMGCRYLRQGPPAALFPVMACAIALFAHVPWEQVPQRIGLIFLGTMLATATGFAYSLYILWRRPPTRAQPMPELTFENLVFEPLMIGLAAGLALMMALGLGLEKPFWAPVSAVAVIQTASLRSIWTRQVHRILGTGLGVCLAWGLLSLDLSNALFALMIGLLTFAIEVAIVRNYGLATIFITPLAILLVEAKAHSASPASAIALARVEDTVVGCVAALAIGFLMHGRGYRRIWFGRKGD